LTFPDPNLAHSPERLWIASRLLIAADAHEAEQVGTRDEEV
jgi:hypothetical protein